MKKRWLAFLILFTTNFSTAIAQYGTGNYQSTASGIPWFDNKGNIVSAHGACIIKDNNKYFSSEKNTPIPAMPSLVSTAIPPLISTIGNLKPQPFLYSTLEK